MKTLFTTLAFAVGLAMTGGSALAASPAYCAQVATNYVNNYTHPVGGAIVGCVGGGLIANLLTQGNAGATAGGCAVGGAGALIISNEKRQQLYNQAYSDCMGGGGGGGFAPAPIAAVCPSQATVGQTANVRTGPGKGYPVIGQLYAGTVVGIGSCAGSWASVGLQGGTGWVARSLLY